MAEEGTWEEWDAWDERTQAPRHRMADTSPSGQTAAASATVRKMGTILSAIGSGAGGDLAERMMHETRRQEVRQ